MIYSDDAERIPGIARYLASGLAENELVSYFGDTTPPDEVQRWVRECGLERPAPPAPRGELEIVRAIDAYCPTGSFHPDQMLDALRRLYEHAIDRGFSGARASGETTWSLRGLPGS
ncbi:MAG: MEDS domain-containing protein, partial [Deltaproteobacteria bacterium]